MNRLSQAETETVPTPPAHTNSLNRRLVFSTLLISVAISVVVIAVQINSAYHDALDAANARLDEIGKSIVPSLASGVWQVDNDRVALLLDGIVRLPEVSYVRLDTADGDHVERGNPTTRQATSRQYALRHVEGRTFDMGTLRVSMGYDRLMRSVIDDAVATGLTTLLILAISSLVFAYFFRHWVTRHLETIANYTRSVSFDNLAEPLVLAGRATHDPPDELDQMTLAFNRMRESLRAEAEMRDTFETELLMHREHLAELVEQRTAELTDKTAQLERQRDEMERLAHTDSLTGVNNRRRFLELAQIELARCERNKQPLSALMLDIDYFKRINDSYGHEVGDRALQAFCDTCRRELRQIDLIGRLGGEEFAVLLPNADASAAAMVAERVRSAVAALRVPLENSAPLAYTTSIGVAEYTVTVGAIDALLRIADAALYEAKHAGRNQVKLADVDA